MLPPEMLELVLGHLSRDDLVATLTTSAVLHHVAARVLYRALVEIPPKRALRLVQTLARNNVYPALVRRLDLDWTENILTANLLRLLHRALQRLHHLSHLALEFSLSDNTAPIAWILQNAPFSLRAFTTSMRCDPTLAAFFATQPDLVEVCIRGFTPVHAFSLPPTALPHLAHFRTVLSPPCITADFVRGRPIESVSMSLYPGDAPASLDVLLLATRPLRRLNLMSFDVGAPAALVREIARRMPGLEALHAVVLDRGFSTHERLIDTARELSRFTALRCITFVAPGTLGDEDEAEIATVWGKACPTLETIILPKGTVWGSVDGRWVSLQDTS
ncbi:hypothetical protein HD554DRAFT_1297695 [Boletus coccyginus]|nr:hypothetical protein HD554DRAFT_1297695 [Boletus coccyginus]